MARQRRQRRGRRTGLKPLDLGLLGLGALGLGLIVGALGLTVVSCSSDESTAPLGGMSPARHCALAQEMAERGDCLTAGEHLAHCSGIGAKAARNKARARCASSSTSTAPAVPSAAVPKPPVPATTAIPPAPGTAPSPPIIPSTLPTPLPPILPGPQPSGGPAACDAAIAAAMSRNCSKARASLAQCIGARRRTAVANVNRYCR